MVGEPGGLAIRRNRAARMGTRRLGCRRRGAGGRISSRRCRGGSSRAGSRRCCRLITALAAGAGPGLKTAGGVRAARACRRRTGGTGATARAGIPAARLPVTGQTARTEKDSQCRYSQPKRGIRFHTSNSILNANWFPPTNWKLSRERCRWTSWWMIHCRDNCRWREWPWRQRCPGPESFRPEES